MRFLKYLKNQKTILSLVGYIFFSLIALLITSNSISFKPKEIGLIIVSPMQHAIAGISDFFQRSFNSLGELKRLKEEYEELKIRLEEYKNLEQDKVDLLQENLRLKEQLGFSDTLGIKHIAAEVIGRDPNNYFNTIIINKGSKHGVRKDMPVVAFQNGLQGLVGKVVEVSLNTALLLPLYDPRCFVSARLQSSRYEGLVNGGGEITGLLYMQHVHKRSREETKYGDFVVTSGLMSLYPKGITIGRVRAIGAREWETSLEIEIEPIIDFSRLEYVFLLDTGGERK